MTQANIKDSIVGVIKDLTDECSARGIDTTPALVAYTVRSIFTQHIEEFQVDGSQALSREKQDLLKAQALERLQDDQSLPMLTVRMQVDMDLGLAQAERNQKQHEDRDAEHLAAIETELINTRARSTTALESLYRKIVSYTIIASKWGSPNDPQCVRQATAALEQVSPPTDLSRFLAMNDDDKRKHLQDNAKLVLGARVFQTFGSEMADPTTNLRLEVPKKLEALKQRLQTSIEGLNSLILQYNKATRTEVENPTPEEEEYIRRLIDELANRQQFLFFYELLLNKLREISKKTDQSGIEFDNVMQNLRGMKDIGDSAPQAKAFPNFTALAIVWLSFKDCEEGIKTIEQLLARLRKHRDTFQYSIGDQESATNSARIEAPIQTLPSQNPNQEPEKIPKESEITFDDGVPVLLQREEDGDFAFNGFCPVTLVERDGLLLPGDVVLGSVKWERRYYAFVDHEHREKFQADPAKWHNSALDVAKRHPELIPLLGLQTEFPELHAPKIPVRAKMAEKPQSKYRNVETETEVHPVESYIDRTYHWNQWELMKRKKILKGLENKRTKGAQTDLSNYRRESYVQTVDKVDKSEQTMVDSGVSMPRTIRYIAGLRGDSCTRAKSVTLVLDLP